MNGGVKKCVYRRWSEEKGKRKKKYDKNSFNMKQLQAAANDQLI